MHLRNIKISNFRQLEYIEESFGSGVSVIVGRNGVGKSNILEAIRLVKAMLAPRTSSESVQALISLNAMSPHNQQLLIFEAIAGDPSKDVSISCEYELFADEIGFIEDNIDGISVEIVRAGMGNQSPASISAYFSSSEGRAALAATQEKVRGALSDVKACANSCRASLTISRSSGLGTSSNFIEAHFIGAIDRSMAFDVTKFTYFPADRALPRGEVPIQIGQQEAGQSLESHNSQPHLKYGRLKNMIFNAIIASPEGRDSIKEDFRLIFDRILPGKELDGVGVNQHGHLSIRIKDRNSNRIFDIDQMSSGEKSLVLSFLILSRGIAPGGIVLLDEPELHLHPAVCRELVPFLYESYSAQRNIQMIVCSHSAEILSGAFARDGCELFHLVDGGNISVVEPSNKPAVEEALLMLGTSETEGLLYKAIISVEGREDVEVLEEGFPGLLQAFKVKPQGGKAEVLAAIKTLKSLEVAGDLKSTHFFIFDKDRKPTREKSTDRVKILEWDRYCLENYLIDYKIIARLLADRSVAKVAPKRAGDVKSRLRRLAMSQIDDLALVRAFEDLAVPAAIVELADVKSLTPDSAWEKIREKLKAIRAFSESSDLDEIASIFQDRFKHHKREMERAWNENWVSQCNGKVLFADCYAEFDLVIAPAKFKRRIVAEMRVDHNNENWKAWEGKIRAFVNS